MIKENKLNITLTLPGPITDEQVSALMSNFVKMIQAYNPEISSNPTKLCTFDRYMVQQIDITT